MPRTVARRRDAANKLGVSRRLKRALTLTRSEETRSTSESPTRSSEFPITQRTRSASCNPLRALIKKIRHSQQQRQRRRSFGYPPVEEEKQQQQQRSRTMPPIVVARPLSPSLGPRASHVLHVLLSFTFVGCGIALLALARIAYSPPPLKSTPVASHLPSNTKFTCVGVVIPDSLVDRLGKGGLPYFAASSMIQN